MYSYNTFYSPHLNGVSLLELMFGRKPRTFVDLETYYNIQVSGSYKEYYEMLKKEATEDLVYIKSPLTSQL